MTVRRVDVGAPYDLGRTTRSLKWSLFAMTMRNRGGSVERASRTPDGPGSARYVQVAEDVVEVEAWGPGAGWLLEQAPALERVRVHCLPPQLVVRPVDQN